MDDAANGRRDPTNSEDLDRADINPAADFKLSGDDEALAVAEKLGSLKPVRAAERKRSALAAASSAATQGAAAPG